MLNRFVKYRPKHLLVVYVEPQRVDVLRAKRKWRSWQLDSVEHSAVPEGEGLFDFLQRINLRPRSSKGTALILLIPRLYYDFHREYYPATLGSHLEETLRFDWPENIFQEPGETFHFFGKAMAVNHHLSVPIFSLRNDLYEKFYQALGGANFQSFNVVPTAPNYKTFLTKNGLQENPPRMRILARISDFSSLEVHKFYNGVLLDSTLIRKDAYQLELFRETLKASCFVEDDESSTQIPIYLLCQPGESSKEYYRQWQAENLPLEVIELDEPLVSYWVDYLLEQEPVETFNPPLLLKPWEIPKAVWIILAMLLLYSVFGFYQINSYDRLSEKLQLLKKQRVQLEAEWKPIEELQNRVGKFQEDQKALAQFNDKGYPMLGILTLLTEVTPQDTWLNYLSLRQGELMLRGESTSAIKYLTELSQVKGFEDVRFASPVTRNPSSDKERFNIQTRLNMQVLKGTLETFPLEGGIVEIPKKGPEGQTGQPQPPTPPGPESPPLQVESPVAGDDNATMTQMSPPMIADDNATMNQSAQ